MQMAESVRQAAVEALAEQERTRMPVSQIYDRIADESRLNEKDRQLAKKIIYGVLRNRDYLSSLLELLCSRPLTRIKPYVRLALLSGLYQIYFLDRIPASAAVNETVKVVKAGKFPKPVQGFVNGVLRQSIRQKEQLPKPEDPDADGQPRLNHPVWLTQRWRKNYGTEAMVSICRHNNREPVLCLRVDSEQVRRDLARSLEEQGAILSAGAYAPDALVLSDYRGTIGELQSFAMGKVAVQDQASQLVSLLLAPFLPGLNYLDGCAGLGTKTRHLIALLGQKTGSITAVEPELKRFRILQPALARFAGDRRIVVNNQNLQEFRAGCREKFERILIDAPCSGTGVIGRHPDIRWNREERDLARYRARQLDLLEQAGALLSPGGVLVYTTCSIEPEENDQVVDTFLDRHDALKKTDCREYLPPSCRKFVRDGYFAPLPEFTIDGFFAARLVRA